MTSSYWHGLFRLDKQRWIEEVAVEFGESGVGMQELLPEECKDRLEFDNGRLLLSTFVMNDADGSIRFTEVSAMCPGFDHVPEEPGGKKATVLDFHRWMQDNLT